MDLNLEWHSPLSLKDDSANNGVYAVDLDAIPRSAGVYIFLRIHGATSECLYVGRTTKLQGRIKTQLNNSKLMQGIKNSSGGKRQLLFAEFKAKQGQKEKGSLLAIERSLIRHYLALGDQLLNVQGTRRKKHSVTSVRPALKKFIPRIIYFES